MRCSSSPLKRRGFIKSAVATFALPALESLSPRHARAAVGVAEAAAADGGRNMVCIGNSFGMHAPKFFPKETGRDWQMTHLLQPLEHLRDDFSIFAHLDHGVKGGHFAVHSFLSGVRSVDAKGMPDGNISLDQRAAEVLAGASRFSSLTVGSEGGLHGGPSMCWTRSGVRVPPINGPRELFRKLFVNEAGEGKKRAAARLELNGSILDTVLGDAKRLQGQLSGQDREKLDEFFGSVRDVERRIEQSSHWNGVPKPKPSIDQPTNDHLAVDIPELYDLVALAIEMGLTRIATLELAGSDFNTSHFELKKGYHSLSHHGSDPTNIEGLVALELYQTQQFARFLDRLKAVQVADSDDTLLDRTMVLFGSGMGNANSHSNTDLPIVLAGGGFTLGEYRRFPEEKNRRVPLSNLFLSMLHQLGVEDDRFAHSTGTLSGLEA